MNRRSWRAWRQRTTSRATASSFRSRAGRPASRTITHTNLPCRASRPREFSKRSCLRFIIVYRRSTMKERCCEDLPAPTLPGLDDEALAQLAQALGHSARVAKLKTRVALVVDQFA